MMPRWIWPLLLLAVAGCGYRALNAAGAGAPLQLVVVGGLVGEEPHLPQQLVRAFHTQLAAKGIPSSVVRSPRLLEIKVVALQDGSPLLGRGGATLLQRERLRLELRLRHRERGTLWRSGLLEVEASWARDGQRTQLLTRQQMVRQLCQRAAELGSAAMAVYLASRDSNQR